MRVAVTGASGFTGRYLMRALGAHGMEPAALNADVTDRGALRAELEMIKPAAVVHLAAKAFVNSDDFESFYSVNQTGTFNLLKAIDEVCPDASVLLASSAQVYGSAAGLLSEEQPLAPANHYALSKAAMEMGAGFWSERLRIIVARPFNYTGVGQETRYLVPKIVDHFARRAPVIELGNIDVQRDIGDVRGVTDAYCGLLAAGQPGTFNISTEELVSVRDIIDMATDITGHRIDVRVNPAFVRSNDVPVLGGSNAKLRQCVGNWKPVPIAKTLAWMLAQPAMPEGH